MKRERLIVRTSVYSLILLFLTLLPASTGAETPLAVIMSCKGEISVVTVSGETNAATFGYQLQAGDVVKTGEESSAEILFEDGNWIAMGSGSSLQIKGSKKKQEPVPAEKKENFQVVQNFLKLKDSGGTSSLAGLRSGSGNKELTLASPCQTMVRDARPSFSWTSTDSDLELCLTIYDEGGIFWKADIPAGEQGIAYPDDAPALSPGVSYSWTVETTDPLLFPPLRSQAAFFEILPAEGEEQLTRSLDALERETSLSQGSLSLYRASIFFEHNLLEDAIKETKKALESDPANKALHSILARLYAEAGRNEDALQEYDRLLDKK